MSQAGVINTTSGPVPPAVPTSFVTDSGTAIPVANVLTVPGNSSSTNVNNGVQTTGSGSTLTVQLTNRVTGSATTAGAATSTIITFTPTLVGAYSFEFRVAAYNTTSLLGAGYALFGAIRFDGVNANLCDQFDETDNEEGTMSGLDVAVTVSGASLLLRGTGYAGQTVNWSGVGLYTYVGA